VSTNRRFHQSRLGNAHDRHICTSCRCIHRFHIGTDWNIDKLQTSTDAGKIIDMHTTISRHNTRVSPINLTFINELWQPVGWFGLH